ncbi:hypothetical protein TVAG_163400 [Trichomonas vaginalis G3]|uniref:Haloacid dehalogenase-like hydrolase family protein n=1 Tax=Trichomonas vaginalis (strain ATCC PRA-98 / G3) TaxID=412133 RepID=A2DG17_TRIV3|nr:HAD-like family [Trichomonas vaginalis G3]EAY20644.1 hypothetical protein TVAG_163400 [Trichomonas vaginalis G3]KAI5487365.1 HAD-like family [Trichomonas vaginalis G3]|eukprot:XP_001581630.1 hypothetical protein [Trichomonas vaginalis G3]
MISLKRQTLLIDLDDVVYDADFIPLGVYFDVIDLTAAELNISPDLVEEACEPPKGSGAVGVFNWILRICENDLENYLQFCELMCQKIDYSKVERDYHLYVLLCAASKKYNVYLATNNCRSHVDRVLRMRFGKNVRNACIKCIAIEDTFYDGMFHPKEVPGNLSIYAMLANTEPPNCTLYDDTMANLECARRIGMKTLYITKTYSLTKALEELLQ